MFRELRRKKNAIPLETAKALLHSEKRGVFAVNGEDGYPFAIPVDYYYDEPAGKIYFHGARSGLKVECLAKCDKVCFTVYGNEFHKEGEWAPFLQSALVYGRCRIITDPAEMEEPLRTFALKYYPTAELVDETIKKEIHAAALYEITIEHLSGKQIQER